jgi:hypothetical protein
MQNDQQHTDTCSALASTLDRQTSTYTCECGAINYAICVCCSTVLQKINAPDRFARASDTATRDSYILRCDSCREPYCDWCANLSFAKRTNQGNYLCQQCSVELERQQRQTTNADMDEVDEFNLEEEIQSGSNFNAWSISFNVTHLDTNRHVQNRTTIVPVLIQTLEEAKRVALDYVRLTLRHTLDRATLENLLEACLDHLSNNKNVASPTLAQQVFNVEAVDSEDRSQSTRCVIILTPFRTQLVMV